PRRPHGSHPHRSIAAHGQRASTHDLRPGRRRERRVARRHRRRDRRSADTPARRGTGTRPGAHRHRRRDRRAALMPAANSEARKRHELHAPATVMVGGTATEVVCPHVRTSGDGTSWCDLAEEAVREAKARCDELEDDLLRLLTQRKLALEAAAAEIIPGPDHADDTDRRKLIETWVDEAWEEVDGWKDMATRCVPRMARAEIRAETAEAVARRLLDGWEA